MNATNVFSALENRKRLREEDDIFTHGACHVEKKARPTTASTDDRDSWLHHDSVLNTPRSQKAREQVKYDSDDEASSVVSEPGSPQDVSMEVDDDARDDDDDDFSIAQNSIAYKKPRAARSTQDHRVATPIAPPQLNTKIMQARAGFMQHVRQRHPQENSSDHLDVPSPIDEDEVPTPPSAAEAAGSQLSMLSVSDVDMDEIDSLPTISIEPARSSRADTAYRHECDADSAVDEPIDNGPENLIVRKQRQRSGALSNGDSPVRGGLNNPVARRGFSMGFRADCEKCRLRVPGHMNHFLS